MSFKSLIFVTVVLVLSVAACGSSEEGAESVSAGTAPDSPVSSDGPAGNELDEAGSSDPASEVSPNSSGSSTDTVNEPVSASSSSTSQQIDEGQGTTTPTGQGTKPVELPRHTFVVNFEQYASYTGARETVICEQSCVIESSAELPVSIEFASESNTPVTARGPCLKDDRLDHGPVGSTCSIEVAAPATNFYRQTAATVTVKYVPQTSVSWSAESKTNPIRLGEMMAVELNVSLRHFTTAGARGVLNVRLSDLDAPKVSPWNDFISHGVSESGTYEENLRVTGCNPAINVYVYMGGPMLREVIGSPEKSWAVPECGPLATNPSTSSTGVVDPPTSSTGVVDSPTSSTGAAGSSTSSTEVLGTSTSSTGTTSP